MRSTSSRRTVLALLSTGIAGALAGCTDGAGDGGGGETTTATTTTTPETTETTETTTATTAETTTTTTSAPTDYSIDGPYPTYMATAGRTGDVGSVDQPRRGLSKQWEAFVDEPTEGPYPPVLAGNRLYVAAGETLRRIDPTSGNREWRQEFDTPIQCAPTVAGGMAYVASSSGLYGLDAETGQREWHSKDVQTYMGTVTPPIRLEDTVYVVSSNLFYALDGADGSVEWTGGPKGAPGEVALGAGKAFVGSNDGSGGVEAFSLADGEEVWAESLPGAQATYPRYRDGSVYSTAKPAQAIPKVFAYAHDGEKRWDHTLEDPGFEDSVLTAIGVGEDQVFVGDDSGYLHALSTADGSKNWQNELGEGAYYQLTIAGDRIYAVNQVNDLVVIGTEDGTTLFQQPLPEGCFVPPIVDGQAVYVANDKNAYAFA